MDFEKKWKVCLIKVPLLNRILGNSLWAWLPIYAHAQPVSVHIPTRRTHWFWLIFLWYIFHFRFNNLFISIYLQIHFPWWTLQTLERQSSHRCSHPSSLSDSWHTHPPGQYPWAEITWSLHGAPWELWNHQNPLKWKKNRFISSDMFLLVYLVKSSKPCRKDKIIN